LILGHDGLMAENTDADGVVGSLVTLGVDLQGRTAVVQGTGGAGRGAAVGLHLAGAEVYLRGRSADRARKVAQEIGVGWCAPDTFPEATDVVVNATPLGLADGEPAVFSDREISGALAVVDMVYGDRQTPLVGSAIERGVVVADGREVLLHQGYAQFAAFTNNLPPKQEMREAVHRRPQS
jgi:shikimate 5-dehydrogenase